MALSGKNGTDTAQLSPPRTAAHAKPVACDAMSTPTGPASGLPVRMPRPRQSGRHRRPEPVVAPEGAPALVLAVPGVPGPAVRSLADEVISIARSELPGLHARIGYLDSTEAESAEYPTLDAVLAHTAAERSAR